MGDLEKSLDSRRVFIQTLEEINDPKILIVTCDVGFNYLNETKIKVLNLGVTEASSSVISATLALSGFRVYFYSMINFSLFRPGEFIRNAIVFHNAPVTIIGVKGSSSYKFLGTGHNLLHDQEDFNFCDNIGLQWYNPKLEEVRDIILKTYEEKKPSYIRL